MNRLLRAGLKRCIEDRAKQTGQKLNPRQLALKAKKKPGGLYAFLNGTGNMSIKALSDWLEVLDIAPEIFLRRCDPALHSTRLKVDVTPGGAHGGTAPQPQGQAITPEVVAFIVATVREIDKHDKQVAHQQAESTEPDKPEPIPPVGRGRKPPRP